MSKFVEIEEKQKDITGIVVIAMILIAGGFLGFLIFANSSNSQNSQPGNTVVVDGKQIVEMTAGFSGYTPGIINAKGGLPTILRVKSSNNFGCGSALRIPKLNISKTLPGNGTTDIELGTLTSGTTLDVLCAMGMYRMQIKTI